MRKHATYVPGKRDEVGPGGVDVEVGVKLLFEGHLCLLWTEKLHNEWPIDRQNMHTTHSRYAAYMT